MQADRIANKAKAVEPDENDEENRDALDKLIAQLRNGDGMGRKRKTRRTAGARGTAAPAVPLTLNTDALLANHTGDTVDLARDMLHRLKSDGFDAALPGTPTTPTPTATSMSMRRTRRMRDTASVAALARLEEQQLSEPSRTSDDSITPLGTQPPVDLHSIEQDTDGASLGPPVHSDSSDHDPEPSSSSS